MMNMLLYKLVFEIKAETRVVGYWSQGMWDICEVMMYEVDAVGINVMNVR